MKLRWKKTDLQDQNNDLCTTVNGVYADIVCSVDGKWSCLWNSIKRFGPFDTRDLAIQWFDANIDNIRKGKLP